MRASLLFLLLVLPLLAACSEDSEPTDPCRNVVCQEGFDCRDGECVERVVEPPPTGCQSNTDCQFDPAGTLCDRSSGSCVQCLKPDHCVEGRTCSGGVCAGSVCTTDADCAEGTPYCAEDGASCLACRGDQDCAQGEACDAGACVDQPIECTLDADCEEADPSRPFCEVSEGRGLCVECRSAADCEGVECVGGSCVSLSCASDEDCSAFPDLPRCGEASTCVECVDAGDCESGEICVDNACEVESPACTSDEDCAGNPAGELCDEGSGECVACVVDGDCGGETPRCSGAGVCVGCLGNADCTDGKTCLGNVCTEVQECAADPDCKAGYVCATGSCVTCRTDDQCVRGTCSEGACVNPASCVASTDCAEGVCSGGVCRACATSLDCATGLWCDGGACVGGTTCAANGDCGSDQICDAGACVAATCTDDDAEPDDGLAAATPIAPGSPISRSLCPNDEDWFVFTAAAGSGLQVQLLAPPIGTSVSVVWFEPGTKVRKERTGVEGRIAMRTLPQSATGRYFVRVRSGGAQGSYTILTSVQIGGGTCTDALEPNDRRQDARTVPGNSLIEGLTLCNNDDFYKLDVPAGRTLGAYAFFGSGSAEVEIFSSTGSRLAGGASTGFLGGGRVASYTTATAQTLLVKVSGGTPAPESYSLYLATDADTACDAAPTLIASGADRGRIRSATLGRSADQDAGACGGGGPDAVYEITLDELSRLHVAARAAFPVRLSLQSAGCGSELTCAAAVAEAVGVLDVPQLAAGTYALVISGSPTQAGPFEVAARLLAPITPPANDACADATALDLSSGSTTVAGTTLGAVSDLALSCSTQAPDVFYDFRLTQAARVVAEVVSSDPVALGFVDGCSTETGCAPAARTQRLDVNLGAGNHELAIASPTGAAANFTLTVTLPPDVANDTCADAATIRTGDTLNGDTTWARADLSFPISLSCTGYYVDGNEVFYEATMTAGQQATFTVTPGTGYDVAVYAIGDCAAPMCLEGADDAFAGGQETMTFTAPSAGTYRIVVDGAQGGGTFSIGMQ